MLVIVIMNSLMDFDLALHVLRLTEQCWDADMKQRPSFIEIIKHLEKIKENLPSDHHWHLFTS